MAAGTFLWFALVVAVLRIDDSSGALFLSDHQVLTALFPSSRQAIKKYVIANNKLAIASQGAFDAQFNKAIKSGVDKGEFTQPKGKSYVPISAPPFCAHCISKYLVELFAIPLSGLAAQKLFYHVVVVGVS